MSRTLRIAILLLVLLFVALSAWSTRQRLSSWERTHWVAVYPINAADTAAVDAYLQGLGEADLEPLERWFAHWAAHYDATIERPVDFRLAPRVDASPPPAPDRGDMVATILWSLHMRWWAWRHDRFDGPADIRVFVAYHDPERRSRLAHSLGLRKAGIGVVHGFGAPSTPGATTSSSPTSCCTCSARATSTTRTRAARSIRRAMPSRSDGRCCPSGARRSWARPSRSGPTRR